MVVGWTMWWLFWLFVLERHNYGFTILIEQSFFSSWNCLFPFEETCSKSKCLKWILQLNPLFLFCCCQTQTQSYVRSCCCCRCNELGCRKSKRDFEKLKENPLAYIEKESINLQIWYFIESQPLQNKLLSGNGWDR